MRLLQISAGIAMLAGFAPVFAEPEPAPEPARGLRPELNEIKGIVYRRSCLAVAQVERVTDSGKEVGSGFFIGEPGQLITVLRSAAPTKELWVNYGVDSMRRFEAKVRVSDPYTGLTLLAVDGVGEVAALVADESAGLKSGDYVYSVAETKEAAESCVVGRVAGREKWVEGHALAASVLRLHMNPPAEGFGAPLLDRDARLVGVLLLGAEEETERGVSYALPIGHVAKLLRDYRRHGGLRSAWLGLGMTMGTSTPEIRSLREGSPAAQSGLQVGDVILSIGGRRVADYQDVIDACYVLTVGQPARFAVLRGLDEVSVDVVPAVRGERDAKIDGK